MLAVGTLVAMVLAGCGWTQTDFDGGHSRANAFESKITAATAETLALHSIPLAPSPLGVTSPTLEAVIGNQLVTQQGKDVVAYDSATCPHADNSACTPLWTRPGSHFWASDGTHLVFSVSPITGGLRTFEVTDAARNHLWDGTVPAPVDPSTLTRVVLSGNKIVVSDGGGSHGSFSEYVNVFAASGCGAPACAPLHTFGNGGSTSGNRWIASGDTLVLEAAPNEPGGVHVFDMTTDVERWYALGQFEVGFGRVRGDRLFVSPSAGPTTVSVYDLTGVAGCSGSPITCSPIRVLDPADNLVYWESTTGDQVDALDGTAPGANSTATHRLSFFAADGSGCTTTPCAPVATSAAVTTWASQGMMHPAIAGDLVLALAIPPGIGNRTYHLLAYDAHLTAGCSGSPKVCQPVADVPITGQNDAQPIIRAVWNGRIYIQVANKILALSLPGDVS
jgi:hypothetical protein